MFVMISVYVLHVYRAVSVAMQRGVFQLLRDLTTPVAPSHLSLLAAICHHLPVIQDLGKLSNEVMK